jgi:hypothetical protein
MAPYDFHELYLFVDVDSILGYPNHRLPYGLMVVQSMIVIGPWLLPMLQYLKDTQKYWS